MKQDEKKIIHLLKEGDNNAYKYIYEHYFPFLCSVADGYIDDDTVSKYLVVELITNIWEKHITLEINTNLRQYLIRAIRNRCVDYLQSERMRHEIPFSNLSNSNDESDENECISSSSLSTIADSPLDVLLEKELEEKIKQAIDNLPEIYRKIFMMSRYEEKSIEQISKESNISVNTVKYHIKNSLRLLREDLKNYLQ